MYESHRKSERGIKERNDDEMMFDEKRWVTERVTREGWVSLKIPRGDIDGLGEGYCSDRKFRATYTTVEGLRRTKENRE